MDSIVRVRASRAPDARRSKPGPAKDFLFSDKECLGFRKEILGFSKLFLGRFVRFQELAREKRKFCFLPSFSISGGPET
jgi:hypothetical protein